MKESVKDIWVAALRSGKYKQTGGFLKTDEGYCCLGVLCDVYAKTQKKKGFQKSSTEGHQFYMVGDNLESYGHKKILKKLPPDQVYKWAGMKPYARTLYNIMVGRKLHHITTLPELNDLYKYTFDQIADVIEARWQQL